MPEPPVLVADELVAGYASREVLRGVSLRIHPGEVVTIIGHNGAGKTTLLRALFGLIALRSGTVEYFGERQVDLVPRSLVRLGVAYLPQSDLVFPHLTVEQNLLLAAWNSLAPQQVEGAIEAVLGAFPSLQERRGDLAAILSGGQQKILVLARALLARPRILFADEPTAGLAAPAGHDALRRLVSLARSERVAVLLVEQRIREVVAISDRAYVLRNGRFAFAGPAEELREDSRLRSIYLMGTSGTESE